MLIACSCVTPDKRLIAINDAELDQECSCNCLSRVSTDTYSCLGKFNSLTLVFHKL
jgi:hypothetical protein